jgi:starch-binding outer membrane protein, SusD/RagB family
MTNSKMNRKMKRNRFLIAPLILAFLMTQFSGCKDLLDADADEVLGEEEVYRDKDDADAAIRGIYGQMMDVATQYVVLNELRADLMDITYNADLPLIELSQHRTVSKDNKWASPRQFFSLINNCNDVIKNFEVMYANKRINREQFNMRYSDVVAVRSWAYLQVSLHFADAEKGGVPYFTKPLSATTEVTPEAMTKYPFLDLPTMIDTLLNAMEALPYKKPYADENLVTTIDGFNSRLMYIDKEYLLGELHLWKGNYHQAACYFKDIMERGVSGNDIYDLYKLPFDASATLAQASARFNSGYVRFYGNDRNSAMNMWPFMFLETQTANYYNEWFWVMYFNNLNEPNTFIDLFSMNGGNYLLKPSKLAIENWDNQIQSNTFPGDFRGYFPNNYGLPGSYDMVNGEPVIMKYTYDYSRYNPTYSSLNRGGKWFLWRAGGLHLRYSEAANRDGQHKVAYAIMNNGISANYPGADTTAAANDYTLRRQTLLAYPYDFDARSTGISDVPPNLRQPWFRNMGIRNRVSLQRHTYPGGEGMVVDSLKLIEKDILDECALEMAFEGQRWGDLVRMSIRNNDNSILASHIADKLNRAGLDGEALRIKLMDRKNWFLPLE